VREKKSARDLKQQSHTDKERQTRQTDRLTDRLTVYAGNELDLNQATKRSQMYRSIPQSGSILVKHTHSSMHQSWT